MNKVISTVICTLPFVGLTSVAMACEPCGCDTCSATNARPVAWLVPNQATPDQACVATGVGDQHATQFQDNQGRQIVVCSGQGPSVAENSGPPPSFEDLDQGHKGYLTEEDAKAYPPLENDFLYASHEGRRITRASYENWVRHFGQ